MKPLTHIIVIIMIMMIVLQAKAQEQFFNSLLQKEDIFDYFKIEFVNIEELDVEHNIYYHNNSRVVEFFDRDSKEFLGVLVNIEKNSMNSLDFVKNKPKLKSLLVDNPPDMAMALFSSKLVSGMSISQVEDILGKPNKMKYSIKGIQQLLKYVYKSGDVIFFLDGKYIQNLN